MQEATAFHHPRYQMIWEIAVRRGGHIGVPDTRCLCAWWGDRRYAITSSPPRCFSNSMVSFKAAMAVSTWSSAGGWVVMRCNHSPGLVSTANKDEPCLAAKRINSYDSPAMTGNSAMRKAKRAQKVVAGTSM